VQVNHIISFSFMSLELELTVFLKMPRQVEYKYHHCKQNQSSYYQFYSHNITEGLKGMTILETRIMMRQGSLDSLSQDVALAYAI
jgi:hypothetical protein